ncbi:HTH domain-containing protein [Streptococcus respiraculi]|uniref:HTH domain-containing protein n=1 Tax=Streptococcus respiraculi TaxID=2021971 RepID=UPI0013C4E9D6|nr:helix-turn-helix domain-containing protein [Streptococcus respiraculi]
MNGKLSLKIHDEVAFKVLVTEDLLLSTDLNSFHKRQAVFFQILLEADGYVSADMIAEQLGISRRSLTRDINRMKMVLEGYRLKLLSKSGVGIRLVGSELAKRLLYLYEVMDYLETKLELPKDLMETYTDFVRHHRFPIDVERTFHSTLLLTVLRRRHSLDEEDFTWFTSQESLDLPAIFYDILSYFMGRSLTKAEREFLTFPMQLGLLPAEIARAEIREMAEHILRQTVQEFGITLDIQESAQVLQRHLVYMLNRSVMKWRFEEVSLREQLIQSSFSKIVSQFFVNRVVEMTGLTVSEKEVVLLAAWMELLMARKSKPLIGRVAVITQSGQSFNYLVETQIRQIFGEAVQLDFLDFVNHLPYEELNQHYDLIFTDNLMYSQNLFQPFLSLSLVTKENQAEREALERTVLGRKIEMYSHVINVQFETNQTYEENLDMLLAEMVKQQLISSEALQKLKDKEAKNPAISEDGYAFPHLTDASLTQLIVVVSEDFPVALETRAGQSIRDFILLFVPMELDDFNQDLLFKIFDNTFRMSSETHIKERLGLTNSSEKIQIGQLRKE